jgi:hypothetical protein
MTDTTTQLEKLSEINEQNLRNIKTLELQEQDLFAELNRMDTTTERKRQLIDRINELSQIRKNLYDNSRDLYSYYNTNVSAARSTLSQELTTIDILEGELNEAKRRFNAIQDQKNDKLRLVQINTYYGKRYNAQTDIMRTIVYACVIIFVLLLLRNKFGVLPNNIFILLVGLVLTIAIARVIYRIIDISNRDNMNFDEYNWKFDKNAAPMNINADPSAKVPWTYGITCIGSQCCDTNSEFNTEKNICVPKTEANKQVETFTAMSQFSMGTPNVVARLFGNQVVPMESQPDKISNYASI